MTDDLHRHAFVAKSPLSGSDVLIVIYRTGDTIVHVELATRTLDNPTWSPPLRDFREVD